MAIERLSPYKKWNVKALLTCHLIIGLLIGTYFWPPTRVYWDSIDQGFFKIINKSLEGNKGWQTFWALANHKYADWVEDVCIIAFFSLYIKRAHKHFKLRRVAEFLFCILYAALVIFFVNELIFRKCLRILRPSPTLVLEPCIRLSQEIPWLKVKDMAIRSFPGDHATTALLFAGAMLFFVRGRTAFFACLYSAFLCFPRLITGAHWLSDVIMGSGSIALFFLSWVFFTPVHAHLIPQIEKGLHLFVRKKSHVASNNAIPKN